MTVPGHVCTQPRGPIAAMYSSPGPCYALPGLVGEKKHDPRSVHNRNPAYIFGKRFARHSDDCSPGPVYLPHTRIIRTGMDGTPHYSLYGRQKDGTQFITPGPGAYNPETAAPVSTYKAPEYSFGTRQRHKRTDDTPAPNNYSLPHMLGKTVQGDKRQFPCYSMTSRSKTGSFHEDLAKTPGPGTYVVTEPGIYKNKSPHYSMTSRNPMPGDSTLKPGPGAHSPEQVKINKKSPASYSFGIRHSNYICPLIVDVAN